MQIFGQKTAFFEAVFFRVFLDFRCNYFSFNGLRRLPINSQQGRSRDRFYAEAYDDVARKLDVTGYEKDNVHVVDVALSVRVWRDNNGKEHWEQRMTIRSLEWFLNPRGGI